MSRRSPASRSTISRSAIGSGFEPIGITSAGLATLTAALWGGTSVAISYSVDSLPPIAVAGIRFLLAALFMVVWSFCEGSELRLRPGQIRPSLIAGGLLFLQISLFHIGVEKSNSSHATLLINTFVIWVAMIGHFVTEDDKLTWRRWIGLAIAVSGVVLILVMTNRFESSVEVSPSPNHAVAHRSGLANDYRDLPSWDGDFLLLVSSILLGIKIIYTKHALQRVEPNKLIFWHDVVGTFLFAAYSGLFESVRWSSIEALAVWGLLYQGIVVAGFCFAVQTKLLRKHSASRLSMFAFATPLFGILLAFLFRGDPMSSWLWMAGLCVAIGIVMVNRPPAPAARAQR